VIPVFGMQADAAVNLIGASGQLHDDNRTVFACQFLYFENVGTPECLHSQNRETDKRKQCGCHHEAVQMHR
jgi:hypothetical protein